jgi:hypothetical protein
MWIVVTRPPQADAAYWPGRRWLAGLDAVVWPALLAFTALHASMPTGLVGQLVPVLAIVSALGRLHRALWLNHRSRFTTW